MVFVQSLFYIKNSAISDFITNIITVVDLNIFFDLVKEAAVEGEEEEEVDPEDTIPILATASSSDGHIKLWKLDPRPEKQVSTVIIVSFRPESRLFLSFWKLYL